MKVKIINNSGMELPSYATPGAAGMDLRAVLESTISLGPLDRFIVKTGLFLQLPAGYEAQVRPRSGLAANKGLTVLNSPGTIDADYRGEIGVILVNLSNQSVQIEPHERIAQLVVAKHEQVTWEAVNILSDSERSSGGFGSTGSK